MDWITEHQFPCGLRLVAEQVPAVRSVSLSLLVPAGTVAEPPDQLGVAALVSEMICRGAGDLDARAHSEALDRLGVERGTGVYSAHLSLGASMVDTQLEAALPLLLDMVIRPQLPRAGFEPSRELALQAIEGLADDPGQKVVEALRKAHLPPPFNRSSLGEAEHLERMRLRDVRQFWEGHVRPGRAILGVAGRFEPAVLIEQLGVLLESWHGTTDEIVPQPPGAASYVHEDAETVQTQIALGQDGPRETDPQSVLQRAAVAVLSGGMSGRLFTEVREKRGLCYSISTSYSAGRYLGMIFSHAGTTTARAQETLDVLLAELERMREGVTQEELERAKIGMRSRLVMAGESTASRAGSIASDVHVYGRPRSLEEWLAEVDGIELGALNRYLADAPRPRTTLATIGAARLAWQG